MGPRLPPPRRGLHTDDDGGTIIAEFFVVEYQTTYVSARTAEFTSYDNWFRIDDSDSRHDIDDTWTSVPTGFDIAIVLHHECAE